MNVWRVEGLVVNGSPVQTHARGQVLDYVFVPVSDTESLMEGIGFYMAVERHITKMDSVTITGAVRVGKEDPEGK